MDHLPYPTNPVHAPLHVPNLVNADTVVNCHADRPVQRWRTEVRCCGARSLRGLARRLQKWLYFGLISRSIGKSVAVQDFLSDGMLTSKHLPGLLRANLKAIQADNKLGRILQEVELELRAFTVEFVNASFAVHSDNYKYDAQVIILSIRILTDSLWRACRNHEDYAKDAFMRHDKKFDSPFAHAGLHCAILRHRMSWEDGWCPSMVSSLLQTLTASTAYYLSAINRSRPELGAPNHRNCTYNRCKLDYNEKNYQQAHTRQCQDDGSVHCEMVQAPLDDVMDVLEEGGIPLMKLQSNKLVASRAKYGLPYVAATHVWAGGLGNPKGNAVWLCQLQEIVRLTASSQRAINRFEPGPNPQRFLPAIWETIVNPFRLLPKSPPAWFWMDTLNVPRVDEASVPQEYANSVWEKRTFAVDRMTQTYAAADSAIVLDPELRQLDLQWSQYATDIDDNKADQVLLQIFSSILVSSWMTRCWTYQEGAMAKELLIKLGDDLFPMRLARSNVLARNRRRLRDSDYSDIHDMLDETSAWFSRLPATREIDASVNRKEISEGEPEVFTRIWNDVAARSTTRTVDRLSILSLLVDLRPSEVRQEHPRARLKAIFKSKEKLPLALLFQPPLTAEERDEASDEFDKEEKAERDRGKILRPYVEDTLYPLPTSLRSKSLPGQLGWMRRRGPQDNFIFFDSDLLSAGLRQPSLFRLPSSSVGSATTYRLHDGSVPCSFDMHLNLTQRHEHRQAANAPNLYLLVSSTLHTQDAIHLSQIPFYGILLTLENTNRTHTMADGWRPRDVWQFHYICHVSCDSFLVLDSDQPEDSACQIELERKPFTDNYEYRIRCDFSNVTAPSGHRIRGSIPAWITAFDIMATIMPILVLYYLICFGFTCIPVFAHTPGTFSKGWLAMIGFLFAMRWLFFTWNNHREYGKAANEIMFKEWVNGIGGSDDGSTRIIDSRRQHTGFGIHMSPRDTLALALLCSIFIAAGAAKYSDKGLRWMIAVGGSGLGELLLRWGLEMCLPSSRFWGALDQEGMPEHPALRKEYLSPSRLTLLWRELFTRE
ncbi:hypothetical protein MMC12_005589 [Toensbergia leucococca]|nr:hypothetical protein [Toensbergia leucococca]